MPRRRRARLQKPRAIALGSLALVVVGAPLAMAGASAPTAVAITLCAPIAALLGGRVYRSEAPLLTEPLVIACMIAAIVVGFQAVPLPVPIVEWIHGDAVETARAARELVDASAERWTSATLAPVATRAELAEGLAVISVLFTAWAASSGGDRDWVVRIAAVSIASVAAVSLGHTILDLRRPYGVLPEPSWNPAFVGPILNQNMLAGVLGAGVPMAIACGVESKVPQARARWFVLAVALALMTPFCGSRGGLLSLAVGVIALALALAAQRDVRQVPRRRAALIVGAGVVGIVAFTAFAFVADAMIAETGRGLPKLELFRQSLDLLPRSPWTGIGRGAYTSAFVRAHGGLERPEHPENAVIEWVLELGIPTAVVVLAALAWSFLRAVRRARSPSHLGAIAAAISLAVHDQFDFALELGGIGVLGAAVLGAALAPSRAVPGRSISPARRTPVDAVGGVALGVAVLVAVPSLDLAVPRLRDQQLDAIRAREWQRMDEVTRTAVLAHPAEPVFPLLAGHAAVVQGRDDALRWLNRAMQLAPGWYEPHHLAARWLAQRGAVEQAWLEVREVRRIEPGRARGAACSVAARRGSSTAAIRVLQGDPDLLEQVVACAGPDDAATIDGALMAGAHSPSLLRLARAAVRRGRFADAEAMLEQAEESDGRTLVLAEAHRAAGRPREAITAIMQSTRPPRSAPVLIELARAQAAAGDAEGMRSTLDELLGTTDGSVGALVQQRLLLAELEAVAGHPALAMRALQDAHSADPTGPALGRILALAIAEGDEPRARLARRELCRRDGAESPHCDPDERTGPARQRATVP